MIERAAERIINYLVKSEVISNEKKVMDYYKYGAEITLSSILNLILVLLVGFFSQRVLESIIFLILFICIRQLTGGYHADTYFKCNLYLCLSFGLVLLMLEMINLNIIGICGVGFICMVVVIFFCPIENKNKPIPEGNGQRLKIKSLMSFICVFFISIILYCNHLQRWATFLMLILCLIIVLVIISKVKGERSC